MPKRKTFREYYKECIIKGYDPPLLGQRYKNNKTKMRHKCVEGHLYMQRPSDHLSGHGCCICYGNFLKSPEQYKEQCKELGLDLPIEDYVNDRTKIKHRCSKGHVYKREPNSHLKGFSCPSCSTKAIKTAEQYKQECINKGLDLPTEDYKGCFVAINHRCNKCNYIYSQLPSNHLQGAGCTRCKQSRGERMIEHYLVGNIIAYQPQKTFPGLQDKKALSYDFYLPNQNILIEYQGIQHYESTTFGGVKQTSDLTTQQYHDYLKADYANKHGYKLIEIPYTISTQSEVDDYLNKFLKD